MTRLRPASEMGHAFACCILFYQKRGKDGGLRLAQLAMAQLERDGFFFLLRFVIGMASVVEKIWRWLKKTS